MADIVVWHYFRHVLCSMFHQSIKRLRETAFHGFPMTAAGCWQLEASRTGRISLPIWLGSRNRSWLRTREQRMRRKRTGPEKLMLTRINLRRSPIGVASRLQHGSTYWDHVFIGNLGHSSAMFSHGWYGCGIFWAIATAASFTDSGALQTASLVWWLT